MEKNTKAIAEDKYKKPLVTHEKNLSEKKNKFTLDKINMVLIALGVVIIVTGFFLMTGSTTIDEFNLDIFSTRRIVVGPMISFFGFLFIIFAILFKKKK